MLHKYRVIFRDFAGKKHKVFVHAAHPYMAAILVRLKYESQVDLILDVREVPSCLSSN